MDLYNYIYFIFSYEDFLRAFTNLSKLKKNILLS